MEGIRAWLLGFTYACSKKQLHEKVLRIQFFFLASNFNREMKTKENLLLFSEIKIFSKKQKTGICSIKYHVLSYFCRNYNIHKSWHTFYLFTSSQFKYLAKIPLKLRFNIFYSEFQLFR